MKYFIGLLAIAFAGLCSTSCIKEKSWDNEPGETAEERVQIELHTLTDDFSGPVSRADEFDFNPDPMVIVFRQSGSNYVFYEASQSEYDNTLSRSTVMLVPSSTPVKLLLITNVPNGRFYNSGLGEVPFTEENITLALTGKTLAQVEEQGVFQTISLGSGTLPTLPFAGAGARLPMSAVCEMGSLEAGSSIGQASKKIILTRAMAKVYVTADFAVAKYFGLTAVGAVNAPARGSFYNGSGNYGTSSSLVQYGNDTGGMAPATVYTTEGALTTADTPIYIYESSADQGTSLIMKANVNNKVSYYRVPFVDDYNRAIPIKRNTQYRVNVLFAGVGYPTMQQAIQSTTPPDIKVEIIVDDDSYDIVSNEEYYMGYSFSNIEILHQSVQESVLIVRSNIPLSRYGYSVATSAATITKTEKIDEYGLKAYIHVGSSVTEGYVTVRIGSLGKKISVSRHPALAAGGTGELPFQDYVACKIANRGVGNWLSVSPDGITTAMDLMYGSPGKIYLISPQNGTTWKTGGEIDAVRAYSGRSKIYVSQQPLP